MRYFVLLMILGGQFVSGYAADKAGSNEIKTLIQQLDDDDFQRREDAAARLWKIGTAAEPALRAAAQTGDPETKSRIKGILEQFDAGIFADTPPKAVPLLKSVASAKENPARRKSDLEKITNIPGPAIDRVLIQLLRNENDIDNRNVILRRVAKQAARIRLVASGDYEKAAALMEALAPEDEETARDYAVYLLLHGGLREKIAAIKDASTDPKLARCLAYLHLANDDLRAAADAAAKSDDLPLRRMILAQLHDWKALRELPAPDYGPNESDLYRKRAEDYVRLLLIRHFTDEDFPIKPPNIPESVWNYESSLTFAAQFDGRIDDTARMFRANHNYYQTIHLYLSNGLVPEAVQELNSAEHEADADQFVLSSVVEALQKLGEFKKAAEIEARIDKTDWPERDIEHHLTFLRGTHTPDELRKMTAKYALSTNEKHLPFMLAEYFTNGGNYVKGVAATRWWVFLRKQNPETAPDAVLRQMKDKVMQSIPPPEPCTLDLEFGLQRDDRSAMGLWAFKEQKWDVAAENFRAVWEERKDESNSFDQHPEAFCLWSWAQSKGDKTADRLKLSVALLAAASERNDLAWELKEIGLKQEALQQWEVTSRIDSLNWERLAAELAARQQWQQAADWMQAYVVLMPGNARIENLHQIHVWRARALLLDHHAATAIPEVEKALKLLPGDVPSAIDLIHDLDREKQSDAAERVFRTAFNLHTKICAQWPNAAGDHYDLARLCLAAGKELDAGLLHAKRAVELFPYETGYIKTLAEYFTRNGENEKADELKRRASALEAENTINGEDSMPPDTK